jgi:NAD(P)-dependent dehydrogenase (short-subunit alcohol dehydrogenase family)
MPAPSDRVVLIAGASGALGRAATAAFAADGCRLGLIGTNAGRLADVAAGARLAEGRWHAETADVRDVDAVNAAVGAIADRFGRIDVALHLVGGFVPGAPITELDPANLTFMLDQHLWSTLHLARAIVPGMVERGWGRFLAVSSATTASTPARAAVYATAKASQEVMLKVLAKEVAGTGVTVNLVAVRQIDADHAREREPSPKNASWTTPEEIVATFRYLASDDAAAVNGARIPLDGRS